MPWRSGGNSSWSGKWPVIDQDFPCNHPSTSARNCSAKDTASSLSQSDSDLKQWENVGGLTFDENIGGGDVGRAVSGAVAAVRSCVPDAQLRDCQSAAECARMWSGITLLHLHTAGWEWPIGVRQCPVQLAVASGGRNRAAVQEDWLYRKTNKHISDSGTFISTVLNSRPFHFRVAAAASPMGTLSLDVHFRFILN